MRIILRFVQERTKAKGLPGYCNKVYGFPVMTSQEVELVLDELDKINVKSDFVEVNYKEKPSLIIDEERVKSIDKVHLNKWIRT